MKRFTRNISILVCILQLSITVLPTEQVKVAIKSHVDDFCIRAKGLRTVTIEQCYWKVDIAKRKIQENEQTFDVHPADIDEQQGIKTQDGKLSIPFLIRLSNNQQSTSRAATSCLASISSNLTVERCQLRKSRFRISGTPLTKSLSKTCTTETHQASNTPTRYKILSSDQSCLEFMPTNSSGRSQPVFAFTKCTSEKVKTIKQTHLWQFCGKNGNCSLSPMDLNWNSLIKIESTGEMAVICKDDATIHSSTNTPSTSAIPTTNGPMTSTSMPPTSAIPTTTEPITSTSVPATTTIPATTETIPTELLETSTDYKDCSFDNNTNSNEAVLSVANSGSRIIMCAFLFPLWTNLLIQVERYIYKL